MWVGQMPELRKTLYTKITTPPCDLETWESVGNIDHGLRLFIVDIIFDYFYSETLLDDTNVTTCRPGSGPFSDYVTDPCQVGACQFQRVFYSGYLCGHGLKFETLLLPRRMEVCGSQVVVTMTLEFSI